MGNMRGFDWELEPGGSKLPVLPPRRAEKFGAIEEAARKCEQAEMEEHWRLLYVALTRRSEEHTSELQSLMHTSYAIFCLKKNKNKNHKTQYSYHTHKQINITTSI